MYKKRSLFGSITWCGVHQNMAAIVGSYYDGASLKRRL